MAKKVRVYLALELEHDEGPTYTAERILTSLEDNFDTTVEVDGEGLYDVTVLGVGTNLTTLEWSMELRKRK